MRLLVETMHCATSTLRHLNCADLAMIAADLGHAAAVRLGEPLWRGVADYVRLVTLPAESKAITRRLAEEAADRLAVLAGERGGGLPSCRSSPHGSGWRDGWLHLAGVATGGSGWRLSRVPRFSA